MPKPSSGTWSRSGIERKCEYCGVTFYVWPSAIKNGQGKYCSRECSDNAGKTKEVCVCLNCGKIFEVWPSYILRGGGKYCSKECQTEKRKTRIKRICQWCGNEFETTPWKVSNNKGKYCSDACARNARKGVKWTEDACKNLRYIRRGEKAYQWKGGTSSINHVVRNSVKMDKWIHDVFKRDNYRDWFSGFKGTRKNPIEAHHIVPFCEIIEKNNIKTLEEAEACEELWDVSNGGTMLRISHRAHHSMWG